MKYIDIHCHLDFPDYDADREAVLERMKEKEVGAISVGASLEASKKALEIASRNNEVWACVGVHPEEALPLGEGWEGLLEKLVSNPKTVGIGECGLDYFHSDNKLAQKKLFEQQIEFALKHDKPLMVHVREAYDDALGILKNHKKTNEKLRGNIHFFAGDIDTAKKFLDLGFTMSFTGVITFTDAYNEVIKYIPQNSIMSETDAPFVAPMPYRGKRNEPAYVVKVVKKMAEIRGENLEDLCSAILSNAKRVFAI